MKRKAKATRYEKAIARKTGASVRKLRKEQKAAEHQEASISALSKAKERYAERGDVNSCGDWLAVALKEAFRTEDGSFDLSAFKERLKENDLEAPKVDMERHGAIGRFRMCAGLMLPRQATKRGFVVIGGKKITAPGAKKHGRKAKTVEAGA
jgi:hypothetical protein